VKLRRVAALAIAAALGLSCAHGFSFAGRRPAWELPPPTAPDTPVVPPGRLHRATLENGLHVIILEDPSLPRVVLGMVFRRGEAMLPPESAGLATFTAELMERGSGKRDAHASAVAFAPPAASISVSAGWDSLSAVASGLSRDQDELFDLLSDVVLRPRFDASEATRERGETLAALEQAKAEPNTLTSWYIASAVYDGHRFGLPLTGNPETVARFDAADARDFYTRVVMPNDGIFFASGDVDAGALLDQVRAHFGAWQPGTVADTGAPPPSPAPPARRVVLVDRPDMVQARIALSHDGISRSSDDRIPVSLMNSVLGGGTFSSRLMEALRTKAGLTYSVWSDFALRRSPGPFVVSTFTVVPKTRQVIDILLAELERARTDPPSEDELSFARTLAIGSFAMGLETSTAVVQALVDLDVYGLPPDSLDTFRSRVRAVTLADVARVAKKYLHPDRAAIVVVGPAKEIAPQLDGLGPIEIVDHP
jgi:zinc protease